MASDDSGESVTIAKAFVQVMPSTRGIGEGLADALVPQLADAGDVAGDKFGSLFSGKAGTLLKTAGAAIAGYVTFSAVTDAFSAVETGANNVIIATGATGDAAKALTDVYEEVARNVVGDFGDIGSAVGELNTRFGLEGDALERASESTMKYAKVTGQDATKAVQDVASLMNNAGIAASDYDKVLDELTVAGQASGISVGTLAQSVNANAASFKEMGFSTEESIAMLANFEKTGANTSSILAAMKKGVASWAGEGKNASEEFRKFVAGVQDGSVTASDAIGIFGSKGGMAMFDAAQKGQLSFDDMYAAITEGSEGALDQVYRDTLTAQDKFDLLGQNLQLGVYDILEPIVDAVSPVIDDVIGVVRDGVTWFTENAVPVVQGGVEAVGGFVEEHGEAIQGAIDGIGEFLGKAWGVAEPIIGFLADVLVERVLPALVSGLEFVGSALDGLSPAIDAIGGGLDWLDGVLGDLGEDVGQWADDVQGWWDDASKAADEAFGDINDAITGELNDAQTVGSESMAAMTSLLNGDWDDAADHAEAAFRTIQDNISRKLDATKEFAGSAADWIGDKLGFPGLGDKVRGLFDSIRAFIQDPIGAARQFVHDRIEDIKGFFNFQWRLPELKLPHIIVGSYIEVPVLGTIPDPFSIRVDWYGGGGYVDDATLIGAGERGGEWIWPSYPPYLDRYAAALTEAMESRGAGRSGGIDIHDCTFVVRNDQDIDRVVEALWDRYQREKEATLAA